MSNVLANRFADMPVLVASGYEGWMAECINAVQAHIAKADADQMREFAKADDPDWWGEEGSLKAMLRPYRVENGVLQVPVKGVLLHDFSFSVFGMATGYEYIVRAFERGMEDPDVKAIAMVSNSGGGEVAGNFAAVDRLYQMRGTKPMVALVNEHAYSAAMSLASAMDRIVVARSGGVGSIGVLTAHIDRSKQVESQGVDITFIHAGEHKVDGNPYEPLPEAVRQRMQARVDGLYDIFVKTVARNRGMSEQAIRDTEALTYSAEEAISIGLADEARDFDEALAALGGPQATAGEVTMSQQNQSEEAKTFAQEDLDKARAEGKKEGAQAERERIQGILGSEEAKGRTDLAHHLSMSTAMSVEDAVATLKATPAAEAPKEEGEPTKAASHFEKAMEPGNPNIRGEGGEAESDEETDHAAIALRDYRNATGMAGSGSK